MKESMMRMEYAMPRSPATYKTLPNYKPNLNPTSETQFWTAAGGTTTQIITRKRCIRWELTWRELHGCVPWVRRSASLGERENHRAGVAHKRASPSPPSPLGFALDLTDARSTSTEFWCRRLSSIPPRWFPHRVTSHITKCNNLPNCHLVIARQVMWIHDKYYGQVLPRYTCCDWLLI